jgi:hypothetical protein
MVPVNRHLHFDMEKVQRMSSNQADNAKRLFAEKDRYFAEKPEKKKGAAGPKMASIFAKLGKRGKHGKSKGDDEDAPAKKRAKSGKSYNEYGEEISNDSRDHEEMDDDYN